MVTWIEGISAAHCAERLSAPGRHSGACGASSAAAASTTLSTARSLGELQQLEVKPGWARVADFVAVFDISPRYLPKKATQKVLKRLRDWHHTIDSGNDGTVGRPKKIARISDLARTHPELR